MNTTIVEIIFMGIDGWDRAVFKSHKGERYFKTIELMPHCAFADLSRAEQEILLRSLHTTESFDGEPAYPVPHERFQVIEEKEQ